MSNWIQTVSRRKFDFELVDPDSIDIVDIAHSLSNVCRFSGHCKAFYSVAQHCVMVSHLVFGRAKMWGLLHDAHEAYIGDVSSPLRRHLRQQMVGSGDHGIDHLAAKIDAVVCKKYLVLRDIEVDQEVHAADLIMLKVEARDLMGQDTSETWDELKGVTVPPDLSVSPWTHGRAYYEFLKTFDRLRSL